MFSKGQQSTRGKKQKPHLCKSISDLVIATNEYLNSHEYLK